MRALCRWNWRQILKIFLPTVLGSVVSFFRRWKFLPRLFFAATLRKRVFSQNINKILCWITRCSPKILGGPTREVWWPIICRRLNPRTFVPAFGTCQRLSADRVLKLSLSLLWSMHCPNELCIMTGVNIGTNLRVEIKKVGIVSVPLSKFLTCRSIKEVFASLL